MNPDDLTDEKIAEYAAQFEDLPEKVILVEMLAELKALRVAVTAAVEDADGGADAPQENYVCQRCPAPEPGTETIVAAEKRVAHARSEHNTPPGEALSIFEPAE